MKIITSCRPVVPVQADFELFDFWHRKQCNIRHGQGQVWWRLSAVELSRRCTYTQPNGTVCTSHAMNNVIQHGKKAKNDTLKILIDIWRWGKCTHSSAHTLSANLQIKNSRYWPLARKISSSRNNLQLSLIYIIGNGTVEDITVKSVHSFTWDLECWGPLQPVVGRGAVHPKNFPLLM